MPKTKFKQTEIGKIPEDWEVKQLGELFYLDRGLSYNGKGLAKKGLPMANLGTIMPGGGFLHAGLKYWKGEYKKNNLVAPGDIIIANTDITQNNVVLGCPAIIPNDLNSDKVIFTHHIYAVRDIRNIDKMFLFYTLKSPRCRGLSNGFATGTTVTALSKEDILNFFKVPVPSYDEQSSIAKILSDLDSKIELNTQMNQTVESIGQVIFKHWFVDFEFPNEQDKPYKSSGGEMVDSELGKIPKGWIVGKYESLSILSTGKGLKRTEFVEKGKYPVLGANGELGRTDNHLFDEKLILTGRVGTLGTVYLIRDKVWISDNVLISKPRSEDNYYYAYFILKGFDFQSLNRGSTQPLITQTDLKNQMVIIPDKKTLGLFHKICLNLFDKIYQNNLNSKSLSQIRDILLPKLMSGQIRIPVEVK